jgi:hypothetical protein
MVMAGRPPGPTPIEAEATGLAYNYAANANVPGDPDIAIGASYAIAKVNDEIEFIARNPDDASLEFPGTVMSDQSFWGTTATDVTGNASPVTILNLRGDGRVYYEPYGPTGAGCNPFGHFFVIELAELQVQINGTATDVGGTVLAISDGEDPFPQGSWAIYAFYDQSAICSNPADPTTCGGDQPRLGFNTNWIAVWTDLEAGGGTSPLLFTTSRQSAECGGITQTQRFAGTGLVNLTAPAITYKTSGGDPDAATLYFVSSFSPSSGTIWVQELTGTSTAASFSASSVYTPSTTVNGSWNASLPAVKQKGGSTIEPGNGDDRFTAVVVRNHAIWAAQTVALPANNPAGTAVQWWQIAIDGGGAGNGTVTDQERVGTVSNQYNGFDGHTFDASIAVNGAGDVLVGYSAIPYNSSTGSWGYLGTGYTFQSHSDCQEALGPIIYEPGIGLYPPGDRTGDYTGAQVDTDDNAFITAGAYAGISNGSYYYWDQAVARVSPIAPPQPTFVNFGLAPLETECTSPTQDCKVTVTAPNKSKDGDLFILVVTAGLNPSPLNFPSQWSKVPLVNQGNQALLQAFDNCGTQYSSWLLANNFEGTPGATTWNFSVPQNGSNCNSPGVISEIGFFLLDYRNACQNVVNPFNGTPNITAYGYNPTGDSNTVTTGQVTAPDNITLLDIFESGGDESKEDNNVCTNYSSISGSPALTVESPNPACDADQMLAADLYTGSQAGLSYGGYSTSTQYGNFPNLGWQIFVPPW